MMVFNHAAALLGGVLVTYILVVFTYNVYLHPLSKYPGKLSWAAFRGPFLISMIRGRLPYDIHEAHKRHGSVVRIGPDELSFTKAEAWKDIYSKREFLRPPEWASKPPGTEAHSLITAPAREHVRLRKALAPAFTDKAIKNYEALIESYIDSLVVKLRHQIQACDEKQITADLVPWISFTAFDITSNLGWGTSFNCLEKQELHPWIIMIQQYRARLFAVIMNFYPFLKAIASRLTPSSALDGLRMINSISSQNVLNRMSRKPLLEDFMSHVIAYNKLNSSSPLSEEELVQNSIILIVAGSDPLTSVVCGALHYLLKHPYWKQLLYEELRSNFPHGDRISAENTKALPVLNAVIKEALRLCPPTPDSMRRRIPVSGVEIAGQKVPCGSTVGVSCFAMFRSKNHFTEPDKFKPDRWLKPERGDSNQQSIVEDSIMAFQPFGAGARQCLGQGLAWVELRLILATFLRRFEIDLPGESSSQEWTDQEVYWTWRKLPLRVSLRESRE